MFLRCASVLIVFCMTACKCDVDVKWMEDTLVKYFSQPRHHVTNPTYKAEALGFIYDHFRTTLKLETHKHNFKTDNVNVVGVNVIGLLKGPYFNTSDDQVVGIGAHYDTMRNAPGVDDNGAALVTMLMAAREITRQPIRNYTVIFIAFDLEEGEFEHGSACRLIACGSTKLVSEWLPSFWNSNIGWRGIFVMDTIMNFNSEIGTQIIPEQLKENYPEQTKTIISNGNKGDFIVVVARNFTDEIALLNNFISKWLQDSQQFKVLSFLAPPEWVTFPIGSTPFTRSDHFGFWKKNYNAIFITDSAEFRGYMRDCYHEPCDSMGNVTSTMLNFAAKTCSTLISLVNLYSPVRPTTLSASPSGGLGACGVFTAVAAIVSVWIICRFKI